MKKIIASIMCLMVIIHFNMPVYAAENAVACPNQCGGTISTRKETYPSYGEPVHCGIHPLCEAQTKNTWQRDVDYCTNTCGYERYYNTELIDTDIIHSNGD